MVTLVHDDLTVSGNDVLNAAFTDEALDHCHVELAVAGLLARTDLTDLLRF